jgi:hypothetical protein
LPNRRSTVCTLTPAAAATFSSEMSETSVVPASSTVASRIRRRVRSALSARVVME